MKKSIHFLLNWARNLITAPYAPITSPQIMAGAKRAVSQCLPQTFSCATLCWSYYSRQLHSHYMGRHYVLGIQSLCRNQGGTDTLFCNLPLVSLVGERIVITQSVSTHSMVTTWGVLLCNYTPCKLTCPALPYQPEISGVHPPWI